MIRMLGKLPRRIDERTLNLLEYIEPSFKNPPVSRRWDEGQDDWGVMGNDRYGNCVIPTAAHMDMVWRMNELDDSSRPSDQEVIDLSRTMGALNGYVILDRLNWWRKKGMFGRKIWAYAEMDNRSQNLMQIAVNTFGAADIGIMLPRAWQSEHIWDIGDGVAYRPNSWGPHSVPIVGYDERFAYCVTWGRIQAITWNAVTIYCDEAYAVISPYWIAGDTLTPSGFDLQKLHADLTKVIQ